MVDFFDSSRFMPHGMCLLWREDIVALHVISDGVIALAYFSIPLVLIAFMRRRPIPEYRGVLAMFAAFILLCGATHVVAIWTFWNPDYAVQGILKAATALVSIATAVVLWPLLPKFLALPAPSELQAANVHLGAEIEHRREAELRYRGLARDLESQIAERTQSLEDSHAALAASEHCFRSAFDTARFGMTLGTLDGPWTDVNQSFCRMLGYAPEVLLEKNWQGVTHPDDIDDTNVLANELLSGRRDSYSLPKRYIRNDGTIVHAMLHVAVVRDASDEPIFYISQVQDLTELVELEAAARQSDARATTILEGASDAIFELDSDGAIRSCNPAAERMLRAGADALRGRAMNDLLVREDRAPVTWQSLLAHGQARNTGADAENLHALLPNGPMFPVEVRIGSIESDGGTLFSAIVRDVSERVAAEQAIRAAHEELRFHMSNSPLAVIQWDQTFTIKYWSPSAVGIFGWESDEVVGRQPTEWQFIHEDDADRIAAAIDELSNGKVERNRIVNRNYRQDGTVMHAEWFNSVQTDDTGAIVSVLSFVEDITEQVESAHALTRSEAHTKAILDTAVDGIISIEPDGTVLSYNPAAERIFGFEPDEVLGRNVNMLMPAPYREQHGSYLENFLTTGERKVIGIGREVVGRRKDGEEFPLELAVSEVRSSGQRTFTGFVRDISERKRFEQEILEGNLRLQDKDWLLSGHATLTRILQDDPTIKEVGQRALPFLCEYLGADIGAFYSNEPGRALAWTAGYCTAPDPATLLAEQSPSGLAAESAAQHRSIAITGAGEAHGVRLKCAQGEIILNCMLAFPVIQDGEVEAVVELGGVAPFHENHMEFLQFINDSLAMSLTSARGRKQVDLLLHESRQQAATLEMQREELESANDDLRDRGRSLEQKNAELEAAKREIEEKARAVEQANQYKSEFLANMSHELRTPLNSMMVLSRSLAENRDEALAEGDAECARVIYRSGENLLRLINDILDLSKVEAGMLDIEIATVTSADLASHMRELFTPIAASRGLGFDIDLHEQDLEIVTDPMRLQQILRNLLGNAFKFTEAGGVTLDIRESGEDAVEITVSDTGIGVSREHQQRIFDAFQQVDGSTRRRYEGTGLGLSISRQLGTLLHATLSVESEPGTGSRFTVTLPRVHPDAGDRVRAHDDSESARAPLYALESRGSIALTDCHILIVDDDYRSSFALSRLLGECGANVVLADSRRSALDKLAEDPLDLILMSITMPEMNGCDTIREIRRVGRYENVPIIAITTDGSPETHANALEAGACACVCKPIDPPELLEKLAESLHIAA